jgi:ribonuclease HI
MFEQNMDGVTPVRRLTSQDISSPLGATETVSPETGLTGDSKSARRLSSKELSEGFMSDTGGISPIISNTPGGIKSTEKIIGEGEYHPELGTVYNQQLLHERQTATGQFANALIQAGAQIVGQSIQGAAYIADIDSGARLSNDAEADFGNAVADFGSKIIQGAEELAPIYVDPYKEGKFDPGSWSWWMKNLPSAASSVALMIPALGATSLVEMLPGVSKLLAGLSQEGVVAARGFTQAIFSRKAESMMEAEGVYKENYQRGRQSGLSEIDARKAASLAASNTYNKNWALLVQDIPQYMLLNKLGALAKGGKAGEKIAAEEMHPKIANWMGKGQLETTLGKVGAIATDMAGEAGEEIYQYLLNEQSNTMAAHQADPDKNKTSSLLQTLKDHYDDGDLWTSGFWGAAGAGIMQAGFAGMNHKALQKAANEQLDTVTKFSTGLNQANKEYAAALAEGDPIKAEQAFPSLIFNTTLRSHLNGSLKYTREMLNELSKGTSPELYAKWGIDPETQGRLKDDPDFFKKIKDGMDRVVELYDRYGKENRSNKNIKDKDKEPNAQIMANTQFLMENTEKSIPTIEKRRDEAWGKIEKVEELSAPKQAILGLEARNRASQKLLDHFDKTLKERGDKMGEVEKKELELAIEETKLDIVKTNSNDDPTKPGIKQYQAELRKIHKDDFEQADKDNTPLPEDQIDAFRKEVGRLKAANESMKQLTARMKKLREGKSVLDLQKEEVMDQLGIKPDERDEDAIQPDDTVQFKDETGADQYGKVVGVEEALDENDTSDPKYVVQPVDPKTHEPVGEPVVKGALDLFLDEKVDDRINEEIAPDGLTDVEQVQLDGITEEESLIESGQKVMQGVSKLSYSDFDSKTGIYNNRNSEFSKVISDPNTSFTGSKAYFFLSDAVKLQPFVDKYATAKQKPIFKKFLDGKKLTDPEIDILVEAISGDKFNDLVDMLPISVRATIAGKTFEEGLYLHSSGFKYIAIPKSIRRGKKAAIDAYRAKEYLKSRENRAVLLKKLFKREEIYSIGLNRSRGVPNVANKTLPAKERNRKLTAALGKEASKLKLAITVSDEVSPDKASLRDAKDNVIPGTERIMNNPGNVFAMVINETMDGSAYPLKLNRPFISREHAEILFDAFVIVGRAKIAKRKNGKPVNAYNVKFTAEDDRVKGLSAGEVIDLLVNNGREMTEPNTGRFKKRNIKPGQAEIMASKRLYVGISGKRVVLVYGNDPKTGAANTIDLTSSADIHQNKEAFLQWLTTNKRYAIYLSSKKLKLSLNGDFLNKKTFTIGKTNTISRKGTDSYSKFIIDNQLVETDIVRDDNGKLFHDPVINLNITDRYGKVTDQTIKTKAQSKYTPKTHKVVREKPTVQDVPVTKPEITIDDVEDARAFNSTQTVEQIEEEKHGQDVPVEEETAYKNKFSTSKERAVYHGGSEYAAPEAKQVFIDLSNIIETAINAKKTFDETSAEVKKFLYTEQLKVGSKGSLANKILFEYLKDRFAGKTQRSLLEEYKYGISKQDTSSATKTTPAINSNDEIGEVEEDNEIVKAEETAPILEGGNQEEEPTEIPKVRSLNDIMGNFTKKSGNKLSKVANSENGYEIADVHKDIQWAYDTVGISKEDWVIKNKFADLLYKGRRNFALYSQSAILILEQAEVGTVFHEAFHRVSLGYFTKAERSKLYRAARQIYKLGVDTHTDKQVEEFLAEKFENYVLTNGTRKVPGAIERFFQPLLNFIKKIFGGTKLDENEVEQLFRQINEGKFKRNKVLAENRDLLEQGEYAKTMISGTTFDNLNTREDVKDLIKGLTEKLFDVSNVADINRISRLNHGLLVSSIEELISNLTDHINEEGVAEDEVIQTTHLRDMFSEVLGVKDPETGLYDTYSRLIRPQIDSFMLSMGIKQTGIKEASDDYLMDEEGDEGAATEKQFGENVGKIGGDYFKASYERNKKETALANIKFMIATLHEVSYVDQETGEREFERNPLTRMGKFVDFGTAWSKIFNSLYWINNSADMIEELKVLAEQQNYSPFAELAERLENASEMVRNQFFVTVRSSKHDFINFSAYNTGGFGYKFTINKSAFNEAFFSEVSVWNELMFNDDKITRSEVTKIKGQTGYIYRSYFRKEFFTAIGEDYSDLLDSILVAKDKLGYVKPSEKEAFINKEVSKAVDQILFLLGRFNIVVDTQTINRLIKQKQGETVENDLDAVYNYVDTRLSMLMATNTSAHAAEQEEQINRKTMSLYRNEEVLNISRAYILEHPEKIDDMQLGPDKNKYNTFSENNHATEVANRIQHEPGFVENKRSLIYNKRSRLLNDMIPKSNDPEEIKRAEDKRKMFGLRTFSYLQEKNTGDNGRGFLEITELEDYLIKYSAMFNLTNTDESEQLLPLPSLPRKTYFFMSGVRKFDRVMADFKGGKIKFTKEVLDYFYDQYLDELERIQEANRVLAEYHAATGQEKEDLKNKLVKNYHYATNKFDFSKGNAFDFIHFKGFSKTKMGKINFDKKITDVLNSRVKEELEYANRVGIISYDTDSKEYAPGMLDRTHTEEYSTKFDESDDIGTRGAIADFVLNYSMATIEAEKLFLADPAFFARNQESNEVFDDIYKRWFGVGSSGENFAETTESDPSTTYRTLVINTQKFQAPFYDVLYDRHVELWKAYLTENNKEQLTADKIDAMAKKLAKNRLSEYEKVDPSDGQAWISPTMYKKMIERSGMWTPELQAAFEVLNSDKELSPAEEIKLLSVVLNPQKTAYFGTQENMGLDMPIYDKMSMTILFKRLVKGTHIEDILDRMELTGRYADMEGLEKIDVINFDSAIKVGGRRGYELFTDKDKRDQINDFTNVSTTEQYWKNLRKQQVTDPHDDFTEQTLGSQVYKIASSNIIKDKPYGNYSTGMDMLNALTRSRVAVSNNGRHNIEASLGIKDGKISNAKLIQLLRKDAEKAKKPEDFMRSLKIDPKTGRNYLELDAFPDRRWIYSRLMRLVTGNTVDLVTPGAQLIQSSDYGFSKKDYDSELGFNILEQGSSTTYQMECKVSIRTFKHLIPNYEKLTHDQRVKALAGLELSLLGYRIPTQGQNSVVSLTIKEFLQDEAGDVIHLPLAFTTLTGSDFDIDKLFTMFHNYERNEKGKWERVMFSEGTNEEAVQQRYDKKVEELYNIYKNDESVVTPAVFEKLKSVGATASRYMTDSDFAETISLIAEEDKARMANYRGQYIQTEQHYNEATETIEKKELYSELTYLSDLMDDIRQKNQIKNVIREKAIPIKKAALLAAKKIQDISEFANLPIEEQNISAANKNRIIDVFHTVIRDSKHYLSTSQPLGGVTNQLRARAARNERIENGGKVKSLDALGSTVPRFQSETKFKFMTSSKGIGPFALNNAHHSFTQMVGLKMKTKVQYGMQKNGVVPLDLIIGDDKVYITDWLSAMIDAHVDAVKDNYITKLNVNNSTYGVVALMLRLGLGIKTFDFVSQPAIKEYAREYFRLGGRLKQDEDSADDGTIADAAFRVVWNRYMTKLHLDEGEDVNLKDDDMYLDFTDLINDEKQMEKDMDPALSNNEDRNKRQLNMLLHFRRIFKDSEDLNKLVLECRVDTKKIGATPSEQRFALNKLMELEEKGKFPGLDRLINSRGEFMQNGTMLAPMLKNSLIYLQGMLENSTVYGSKGFDTLFWDMAFSIPASATMRASSVNNIVEEMFSYFSGEFFGNPEHGIGVNKAYLEKLLLNGPTSVFGLLYKIRKKNYKLYEELSKNKMLSSLRVDSKPGIPLETYLRVPPSFTANKWDNDDKIDGFYDLFTHPESEVRELARALYLYSYYSTGFRHRFRGYVKHIPGSVQKEINMFNVKTKKYNKVSFNEYLYNLVRELNDGHSAGPKYLQSMKRDIFKNNWFNKWFVPQVDNPDIDKIPYEDVNGVTRVIEVAMNPNSKYALGLNSSGETIYAHFITMKDAAEYNKPTAKQEMNYMEQGLTDEAPVEEFQGANTALLEFVGINEETGYPLYVPTNKKGFYEMGNILREYGVRDEQSVLAQNNLAHQFTMEQTLAFIEKNIPTFKSIPFETQQIVERAVSQKEEYAVNVGRDMLEEEMANNEELRIRILYEPIRVERIISGLQSGIDTEGLLIAKELGYQTGGRTTIDYKQEKGASNEDLAHELDVQGMSIEDQNAWAEEIQRKEKGEYVSALLKNQKLHARTYWNVKNSDATVYFAENIATSDYNNSSKGFYSTRKAASAKYYNKPFFFYVSKEDMDNGFKDTYTGTGIIFSDATELKNQLKKYQVRVLNIAGSRYSSFAERNSLDKLEYFRQILKDALKRESPITEQKIEKDNADNKSNEDSISSFDRPINLYVDGSVSDHTNKYGYGVYANIGGKELGLSGIESDVDEQFFSKFPEVRNQDQFSPSVELLGLVNALKLFENTAEHLVIRQDNDGSVSYVGLNGRAKDDPFVKNYSPSKPHIKYLVNEALQLIEKIESNGGSVRIFYVPGHADKTKIQKYIEAYSEKKGITITQKHIDIITEGNDKADKLANHDKKINTFTKFINAIGNTEAVGLKPGFEKTSKEDERGKEEMLNCKK